MTVVPGQRTTEQRRPFWLVTFADLVALLLAFFVMLFATHKVEQYRWTALIESLSQSLNPAPKRMTKEPAAKWNIRRLSPARATDLHYLETLLLEVTAFDPAFDGVILRRLEDRLVIGLPADDLFAPGSVAVNRGARTRLFALGGLLANIGNRIEVHGHADPTPIGRSVYGSNWELSVARAAAIAEELRRTGYRREIKSLGYADTRFDDLFHIAAPDQRFALARRVDIVVLATKADE